MLPYPKRLFEPGTVLSSDRVFYVHKGIATDLAANGEQLVISCSGASGRVVLEPLSVFAAGSEVRRCEIPDSKLTAQEVMHRAKGMLGTSYSLFTFNCEHFVTKAFGLVPTSSQLAVAIAAVLLLVLAVG